MNKSAAYALPMLATTLAAAAAYALIPAPRMRGRIVVITGGSRGLGFALAQRFARAGAKLVLASRSEQELAAARDLLLQRKALTDSNDILLVSADLRDPAQSAGLVDAAVRTFGRIDVLINNAGIIEVGAVEDHPLEAYERAMQTNYFAAVQTTLAAMPHMLERFRAFGHKSSIVNIASIGGKFAMPHLLPYVASKFALVGFSEGLHAELRFKGIRVTTVCPGLMRTGGEDHAHFIGQSEAEERWFRFSAKTPGVSASVAHAANRIYNATASGRAEITITPQAWLAARLNGTAPATTQYLASLANHFFLPAPLHANAARQAPSKPDTDAAASEAPTI